VTQPETVEVITHSPAETHRLAKKLAATLPPRAVLALHGELGSGKTCFVQGLARAFGVHQPVTSPTFTLIHEYRGKRGMLNHIDLYRIRSVDDAESLDLADYFDRDGVTVIEWAERVADLLPPETIHLSFEALSAEDDRRITIRRE
jgi:tRNA threonylcarbamoyladenosine biosynthesis protein TsaE